jgi:hypothetical protein
MLEAEGFHFDQVIVNLGVATVRKGFYYKFGMTAYQIGERLTAAFPGIEIVERQDIYKAFRGGASIAHSSHFLIRFRVDNLDARVG